MAKVTYSSTKGLVVESGTGFQVNDAPILEEIETLVADEADGASLQNFGVSSITAGGDNETTTLPDGDAAGQLKTVVLAGTAGGELIVNDSTPAQIGGANNLTAAGDFLHCLWTGDAWIVVAEQTT